MVADFFFPGRRVLSMRGAHAGRVGGRGKQKGMALPRAVKNLGSERGEGSPDQEGKEVMDACPCRAAAARHGRQSQRPACLPRQQVQARKPYGMATRYMCSH